jgi:4-hydroxy-2-oxoheptanedioate aldolase
MAERSLKEKLESGGVVLGIANAYPGTGIIEQIARGWDFIWIDGQHGLHSYESLLHSCITADLVGTASLVRVHSHDPGEICRYADLAPKALMIPMVNSVAEARAIANAVLYPPRGTRSFGGRRAADVYGIGMLEHTPLVVAQIETVEAAAVAKEIAEVDGIDGLFFGPDDMKLRMNIPLGTAVNDDPRLQTAVQQVAGAANDAGKFAGIVVDPELLGDVLDLGYRMVSCGSDAGLLQGAAAIREAVRSKVAGRSG